MPVKCWPSPAPTKHRELSSCRLGITVRKLQINLSYKKIIILDGLVAPRLLTHEYGQMRKTSVILRKQRKAYINIGCGSMDDMPCIFNYCVTGIVGRFLTKYGIETCWLYDNKLKLCISDMPNNFMRRRIVQLYHVPTCYSLLYCNCVVLNNMCTQWELKGNKHNFFYYLNIFTY